MFYLLIQKKIALLQIPEKWESLLVGLVSYCVLFLLAFVFKQILSLFNSLVISKAIKKSKNTWDDIFLDLGIIKQSIHLATIIFVLLLYPIFTCESIISIFIKRLIVSLFYFISAKTIALFLDVKIGRASCRERV